MAFFWLSIPLDFLNGHNAQRVNPEFTFAFLCRAFELRFAPLSMLVLSCGLEFFERGCALSFGWVRHGMKRKEVRQARHHKVHSRKEDILVSVYAKVQDATKSFNCQGFN